MRLRGGPNTSICNVLPYISSTPQIPYLKVAEPKNLYSPRKGSDPYAPVADPLGDDRGVNMGMVRRVLGAQALM